jgi:arginase
VVDACRGLYEKLVEVYASGHLPLVIGGDHSAAIATLPAAQAAADAAGETLGVVWLDAHADLSTGETSVSGNIHGMPLAAAIGEGDERLVTVGGNRVDGRRVSLIGIRDVDPPEWRVMEKTGVHGFKMEALQADLHGTMREALAHLKDCERLHVSFDIDFMDGDLVRATGTRVTGGPTESQAMEVMRLIRETGRVASVDLFEVNPTLGGDEAAEKTVDLAIRLVTALLRPGSA